MTDSEAWAQSEIAQDLGIEHRLIISPVISDHSANWVEDGYGGIVGAEPPRREYRFRTPVDAREVREALDRWQDADPGRSVTIRGHDLTDLIEVKATALNAGKFAQ